MAEMDTVAELAALTYCCGDRSLSITNDCLRSVRADLQRARDELGDAEKANADHHYNEAQRYAQSAAVDADVAAARGAAEDAQRAAREAIKGNATLRDEAARGLEMSADRPYPQ